MAHAPRLGFVYDTLVLEKERNRVLFVVTSKMTNPWVQHVPRKSNKLGISYSAALNYPNVKASYKKGKGNY